MNEVKRPPDLMRLALSLSASAEALAALGARLRVETDGVVPHPRVAHMLDDVMSQLGFPAAVLQALSPGEKKAALGAVRSFLRQASELLDNVERAPAWAYEDEVVLQSQGMASISLAAAMQSAARQLPGLEASLSNGVFLDVGVGVGWLSIAMTRLFPSLRVVGVDVWEPALAIARANVVREQAADRIALRHADITELRDFDQYALAFVPAPFLPQHVLRPALESVYASVQPGGWALCGLYAGPPDPLAQALIALRTVRSGGHPWTAAEAEAQLQHVGFVDASTLPRTWEAPVMFVGGRKPTRTAT